MTTAIYLRVSSDDQTLDSQKHELAPWLASQGLSESHVRWYTEKKSGKTLARPELDRLREDVERGEVTTVVVIRLDRLSRTLLDGLTLISKWAEAGVRIVAVAQNLDFSGPVGRLVAAVLLGVAEMELTLRAERQRAGIDAALAAIRRGERKHWGGCSSKELERRRAITAAKAARVRQLVGAGLTVTEAARAAGISRETASRYLNMKENA